VHPHLIAAQVIDWSPNEKINSNLTVISVWHGLVVNGGSHVQQKAPIHSVRANIDGLIDGQVILVHGVQCTASNLHVQALAVPTDIVGHVLLHPRVFVANAIHACVTRVAPLGNVTVSKFVSIDAVIGHNEAKSSTQGQDKEKIHWTGKLAEFN